MDGVYGMVPCSFDWLGFRGIRSFSSGQAVPVDVDENRVVFREWFGGWMGSWFVALRVCVWLQ